MIQGLGSDLIEIERIRESIERHGHHFLNRLFTQKEQDYCFQYKDPAPHFAGRFAAKEAIAKALGTGFGAEVGWQDLEILNNDQGKPVLFPSPRLEQNFGSLKILITISHCRTHAQAVAIWCAYNRS